MMERVSYPELEGWQNYFTEKQKSIEKMEFYLAQLTAVVAGMFGGEVSPADFLLDWGGESGKPAKLDMEELAITLAHALGAKIVDKRKNHGEKARNTGDLPDC